MTVQTREFEQDAVNAIRVRSLEAVERAPAPVLMERFGFTIENVVAHARSLIGAER